MLHRRHTIRRFNIDYSRPNCFFVTICTLHCGYYFEKYPSLSQILNNNIKKLPSYFPNININRYVIMPNHVHLILTIKHQIHQVTLGLIIKSLKSKTIVDWLKYIKKNNIHDIASIWQRNYFERVIRTKSEYQNIDFYIKNNRKNWDNDEYHPTIRKVGV